MNRRDFVKGLAVASAAVLASGKVLAVQGPDPKPVGYDLTSDGYLEMCGQSIFPIHGKTGVTTGVAMRYKHLGGRTFFGECVPVADFVGRK